MKKFFIKVWESILFWLEFSLLPFLKDAWMEIVNFLIVLLSFGALMNAEKYGAATLVGLWLFYLLFFYIFWKLFKIENWFKKK